MVLLVLYILFFNLNFFHYLLEYLNLASDSSTNWKKYAFKYSTSRKFITNNYEDFEIINNLSALDITYIVYSLWLPKYEKCTNYSCDQETIVLECQERQHSIAHAKLNSFLICKFPFAALIQKILNQYTEFIMNYDITLGWNALNEVINFYTDGFESITCLRPILRDVYLWHLYEEFEHGVEFQYVITNKIQSLWKLILTLSFGLLIDVVNNLIFCIASFYFALRSKNYKHLFYIAYLYADEMVSRLPKMCAIIFLFARDLYPSEEAITSGMIKRKLVVSRFVSLGDKEAIVKNLK
jgi:hypothetical protein